MTRKLSLEKWNEIRELTQDLYRKGNLTLVQLTSHLRGLEYDVDDRMMRRKVTEWGYQKKLHEHEVLTAVDLLTPHRHLIELDDASFYVRERLISGHEFTLYLQRKGIVDPFLWAQYHDRRHFAPSIHVMLGPVLATSAGGPIVESQREEGSRSESQDGWASSNLVEIGSSHSSKLEEPFGTNGLHLDSGVYFAQTASRTLNDPDQYQHVIDGIRYAQVICEHFLNRQMADVDVEPSKHADTPHGRFGDRMQHTLSRLVHQDYESAAVSLNEACLRLREFLYKGDPVSLALVLVTLCEVSTRGHEDLARQVLRYANEIISEKKVAPGPLNCLLYAVLKASNIAYCTIQVLESMSVMQRTTTVPNWRDLYIRERLCDGLYYNRDYGSSALMRHQLLADQGLLYGRNKRNVLYTLTNVADNFLTSGNLDRAEQGFQAAFRLARPLDVYGKAKIQFAALEGLARTRQAMTLALISQSQRMQENQPVRMQNAKTNLDFSKTCAQRAREIALQHFEVGSRRTTRIEELQQSLEQVNLS